MTMYEFADTVIRLPVEAQNEFLANLKDVLTEEEWLATAKFISYWSMIKSPAKYKAIRSSISETLFGIPISTNVRSMWDC